MRISDNLISIIATSVDALIKASGMDVRLHGVENVPDQPVIYVVNHFTRMETVLMPYLIRKTLNKYPISLAHKSFFTGKMGDLLDNVGAVSTADARRDQILINALLTDSHPVVIFPEGQIIKDKKIIEKGKFAVYNAGIRRPPHTGAAQIALAAEFVREKLRLYRARRDEDSVSRLAARFDIDPEDVKRIIIKETFIVPVNITYYPVRARENDLSRLVSRFTDNISTRFQEELEVEGPIILGKVDIDIRFGRPMPVKNDLMSSRALRKMATDDRPFFDVGELRKERAFRKKSLNMMHEYMAAIYNMTTVNHDHIMSYILATYWKNSFSEDDFKKRIFLAIEHLRQIGLSNCHTALYKKQFYLLTDDYHEKYENFVKEAKENNYITLENGIITKNKERFSVMPDFHIIRRENIIEVLKNEIEPMRDLTRTMDWQMLMPDFFIKWKLKKLFWNLEKKLFEDDYRQYYIEGESKPPNIGEPFFFKKFFGRKGVILVHGYMAAPEEIRPLADYLYQNGYSVYGARLRGHGTAPEDLACRNWEKWYDSASRAYIIMKNSVKMFSIIGFSMGGAIALLQAANKPGHFAKVISINAPLKLRNIAAKFTPFVVAWNSLLTRINVDRWKMEFVQNDAENPQINYLRNPVRGGYELERLMMTVGNSLNKVTDPTLVMQGSGDPVVDPVSGKEIFDKLGTKDKKLVTIIADHHGILRGREADEVNTTVLAFLNEEASK